MGFVMTTWTSMNSRNLGARVCHAKIHKPTRTRACIPTHDESNQRGGPSHPRVCLKRILFYIISIDDPYAVLGLPHDATKRQIKLRYRQLVMI
jgi:hypothetical protein